MGFYAFSLWKHYRQHDCKTSFVLIDIGLERYIENWSISMRFFNFDFGYISKPKRYKKNKKST
jgi:hypothetical protein